MDQRASYCHRIAVQCGRRADESSDDDVKKFLYRMRDNWLQVAEGLQRTEIKRRDGDALPLSGKTH